MTIDSSRFRTPLLIALAIVLALGSFWLLEIIRNSNRTQAKHVVRSAPDYYIDNFEFIRMTESGLPRYSLSGRKLIHFPLDDSAEIELPIMRRLEKDKPPMTIRSDHARGEDQNSRIHMIGNVQIDRPATPLAPYFHLDSTYLLALPDEDIVETPKAVHIIQGTTVLNGVGMYANNATGAFRLDSMVRGTYHATQH